MKYSTALAFALAALLPAVAAGLAAGTYFLRVQSQGVVQHIRIVVQ